MQMEWGTETLAYVDVLNDVKYISKLGFTLDVYSHAFPVALPAAPHMDVNLERIVRRASVH